MQKHKIKFKEIPQFTRSANYRVNSRWDHCMETLEEWQTERLAPLNLDPDFQRAHVWSREQQIRYVEYKLRGGYGADQIQFNCVGWQGSYKGPFVLVDGKQRIEAVRVFLNDEFKVFVQYFYSDFEDTLDWKCDFVLCVNDLKTRAEVLQWFLDLNSTGTPFTENELDKVRDLLEKEPKKEY